MGDPTGGTRPGGTAGPAGDWSPRFRGLEEVDKTLIRLRQAEVEVDLQLISRVEDFFASQRTITDPSLSLAWLSGAEGLLRELSDRLDGLKEDHIEKMADLNPAQMQAELSKTEAQVRAELNALKGLRFGAEKAAWRDRVDRNLAELRLSQQRQADKLVHAAEAESGGRLLVRPTDEYWAAYSAWLIQVHEVLRRHLHDLLRDRWTRFIDEHIAPMVRPFDARFRIDLPPVPIDDLPNPVLVARAPSEARHYREPAQTAAGVAEASVKMPEEVILAHELDRTASGAAQGGALAAVQGLLPAMASLPVMFVPGVPPWAKAVVGAVVGVPTVWLRLRKQQAVRRVVQAERVEKAGDALKQKLVSDFQKRMERHRMDVEAFVRDYNAGVQQVIFQKVSALVEAELAQRTSLLPQQRADLQARRQRLSSRVAVLEGASRVLSAVLVDLEMRRRVLRDEVTRRAAGGQS